MSKSCMFCNEPLPIKLEDKFGCIPNVCIIRLVAAVIEMEKERGLLFYEHEDTSLRKLGKLQIYGLAIIFSSYY
jgi:hypothetical protein